MEIRCYGDSPRSIPGDRCCDIEEAFLFSEYKCTSSPIKMLLSGLLLKIASLVVVAVVVEVVAAAVVALMQQQ